MNFVSSVMSVGVGWVAENFCSLSVTFASALLSGKKKHYTVKCSANISMYGTQNTGEASRCHQGVFKSAMGPMCCQNKAPVHKKNLIYGKIFTSFAVSGFIVVGNNTCHSKVRRLREGARRQRRQREKQNYHSSDFCAQLGPWIHLSGKWYKPSKRRSHFIIKSPFFSPSKFAHHKWFHSHKMHTKEKLPETTNRGH